MWKLLPACLLVACAANERAQPVNGDDSADQVRIVLQVALPTKSSTPTVTSQSPRKTFQRRGIEGWLDATGAWRINAEVQHGRLRCGIYETGIQLGTGNPVCSEAKWLTDVKYVTRLRHCNSAVRIHAGGGEFPDGGNQLQATNCVRVVVRCNGIC